MATRVTKRIVCLALLAGISAGVAGSLLLRQLSSSTKIWTYSSIAFLVVLVLVLLVLSILFLRKQHEHEQDLQAARRAAIREREQAIAGSKAKSEFLATMSHEIRTPLSGILGYADLLAEERLTADQSRYVERIRVAGESLLTVVGDVLDFSQIESGAITLSPQPFSIRGLVDNVTSIISADATRKGLAVISKIESSVPPVVEGDLARIRQVLLNLLNNAVKFTDAGAIKLSIEPSGSAAGGEKLRFVVEDTGIGIEKEQQFAIFDRFSQIDSSISRPFGGSGLGLAISQQLVNLMGGWIEIESEPGDGATFSFEIILPSAELPDYAEEEEIDSELASRDILVVEDLEENRELARAILERAGFRVDCADDGVGAIAAVQKKQYLVVFMDVQMPRMDGITATRAIRRLPPPTGNVPVIAMTANVLAHQINEFRAAGMDDHVGKPYTRAALLAQIQKYQKTQAEDESAPAQSDSTPGATDGKEIQVFDHNAIKRVRELLGDAWVEEAARRLKHGLDDLLAATDNEGSDYKNLADSAHRLVAQAGQLGFAEISQCCRNLEEAAQAETALQGDIQSLRSAASRAGEELTRLSAGSPLGTADYSLDEQV